MRSKIGQERGLRGDEVQEVCLSQLTCKRGNKRWGSVVFLWSVLHCFLARLSALKRGNL